MLKTATRKKEEYEIQFKPLHREVRQITNRLKIVEHKLEQGQRQKDRLTRNQGTTTEQLEAANLEIYRLELEQKQLQEQIPPEWLDAKSKYDELASALTKAQSEYRRNVDSAYQPLQEIFGVMQDVDALGKFKDNLFALQSNLDQDGSAEELMDKIKLLESELSDIKGTTEIKSQLSKARRALKGDSPDWVLAKEHYSQSTEEFNWESSWRQQATVLMPGLKEYNDTYQNQYWNTATGPIYQKPGQRYCWLPCSP